MNRVIRSAKFLLASLLVVAAIGVAQADATRLKADVEFLASPELTGRMVGTDGERKAAAMLAERLEALGARPLPGASSLQMTFDFTAGMADDGTTIQVIPAEGDPVSFSGEDAVHALSFADNGSIEAPVVFAGYGMTVPEEGDLAYDSYYGLDVKDKVVLVLRYFPEDVGDEARAVFARYSGLRYKALHARELGARAMLVVTGPRSRGAGETIGMTFDTALAGSGILAASIAGEAAVPLFEAAGRSLAEVQEQLDSGNPHVTGFEIPGVTIALETKLRRERRQARNVVGWLPGSDADAGLDRAVVLGAHFDHLGHGKSGGSLADKAEAGKIHLGADDNASGVAAVLAAAAAWGEKPGKSPLVVAFWTGEELGLLGANRFVDDESLTEEQILAYVNLDMVGRMRDNRLITQGAGSSKIWPRLIEQVNVPVGFDVVMQDDPYLPTDSTAFYQQGIPTLNLFTGGHEDYHKPSDRADRINYEDLDRVADFTARLVRKISKLQEAPEYVKVERTLAAGGDRDTVRAFTGTIPDYTAEVQGLMLGGVVGGGPADLAGLQKGDVIVRFAGREITNIYDYTFALDVVKIGEEVEVVFRRDGEDHQVTILPTERK